MRRRTLIGAAAATLALPRLALAAWPGDRPIQVFVPGPPGGGMDILARAVLPQMQKRLAGASFVVLNRPTAGGSRAQVRT